jgi:hypothetical protein
MKGHVAPPGDKVLHFLDGMLTWDAALPSKKHVALVSYLRALRKGRSEPKQSLCVIKFRQSFFISLTAQQYTEISTFGNTQTHTFKRPEELWNERAIFFSFQNKSHCVVVRVLCSFSTVLCVSARIDELTRVTIIIISAYDSVLCDSQSRASFRVVKFKFTFG